MYFCHSPDIWRDFPELAAGAVVADRIAPEVSVAGRTAELDATARSRLATGTEAELPEIQAWRRAFARMGLKPTQYRCASESLLRRLRKEGALPAIHPLIDLCNALSMASAIPIAVFDLARVAERLEVRYADGSEVYSTLSGEIEHPQAGEVIFADAAGRAHARRWTNRQSAQSAVRAETRAVLIVAEAMHATAAADVGALLERISGELAAVFSARPRARILDPSAPRFEL